jgi:hypothetical protein
MENIPTNSYIECASMLKGSGWSSKRSLKAPDSQPPLGDFSALTAIGSTETPTVCYDRFNVDLCLESLATSGRYEPFAKPSANDRCLRIAARWLMPDAD